MNLPNLPEVEKSVLSILLQRRPGWDEQEVDENLFHVPTHQAIFRLLQDEGDEIEIQTLIERGIREGSLDRLGGAGTLTDLQFYEPSSKTFPRNVEKLREASARRMWIIESRETTEIASDLTDDRFLERLGEPVTKIIERATSTKSERSSKQVISDVMKEYADILEGKQEAHGWSVSLPTLTAALKGFRTNRVVVVSGYPSSGKTLLVGQFLLDLARQGIPSMMLSFEMTTTEIAKRMIATNGRFDGEILYDPLNYARKQGNTKPCKQDLLAIQRSSQQITEAPIYFEEDTAPTIDQVCTRIRRAHRKHGIMAFAIDYLQLMRSPGAGSKESEMSTISHALQSLMKELGILLFVLSQQNQEGNTKYATTTLEDADYVLSLIQVMDKDSDDYKKVTGLLLNKDRHTGKGGWTIPLEKGENQLFFKEPIYQTNQNQ